MQTPPGAPRHAPASGGALRACSKVIVKSLIADEDPGILAQGSWDPCQGSQDPWPRIPGSLPGILGSLGEDPRILVPGSRDPGTSGGAPHSALQRGPMLARAGPASLGIPSNSVGFIFFRCPFLVESMRANRKPPAQRPDSRLGRQTPWIAARTWRKRVRHTVLRRAGTRRRAPLGTGSPPGWRPACARKRATAAGAGRVGGPMCAKSAALSQEARRCAALNLLSGAWPLCAGGFRFALMLSTKNGHLERRKPSEIQETQGARGRAGSVVRSGAPCCAAGICCPGETIERRTARQNSES